MGVVIVAHLAYALLVVPLIEPEVEVVESPLPPIIGKEGPRFDSLPWFTEGDWELDPINKMIESPQGILILRDYKNLPDGTVRITPCTMVLLGREAGKSAEQRAAEAFVLQAPEGAVLRLDEPLDIKTGRIGKLVGGRFIGPIRIRSGYHKPDDSDDIEINTRNVELAGTRLATDDKVTFRHGPHTGHGTRMRIKLIPNEEGKGKRSGPNFSGVESIELLDDVWMNLHIGGGLWKPVAGPQPNAKPRSEPGREPVEVSSKGRFRFDLLKQLASFVDDVQVVRPVPGSVSDQLLCQKLLLQFEPAEKEKEQERKRKGTRKLLPKLIFRRLTATGYPVVLRSPSRLLEARGQTLVWDEHEKTVVLSQETSSQAAPSSDPAFLVQDANVIAGRHLVCQLDANGQIDRAMAEGPGRLRFEKGKGAKTQRLEAHWTRRLNFGPHENMRMVTLEGDAAVSLPDSGQLTANEIFLWLVDVPQTGPRPPARPTPSSLKSPAMEPHKLSARGNVVLASVPMTANVEQLQVWFDYRRAATVRATPVSNGPRTNPTRSAAPKATPRATPPPVATAGKNVDRRYNVRGQLMRARLIVQNKQTEVGELWLQGDVAIDDFERASPQMPPIHLAGETLHVLNDDPAATTVRITGRPAHVEGEKLTLEGGEINLDRSSNHLWVTGPGLLKLPAGSPGELNARPRTAGAAQVTDAPPLVVRWQQGMNFDGQDARFDRQVIAQLETRTLETETMIVRLTQRLSFTPTQQDRDQPKADVDEIRCPEAFHMESRTLTAGRVTSMEQMDARQLVFNNGQQRVTAEGPGRLIRRGLGSAKTPAAGRGRLVSTADNSDPAQLTYLETRFDGALSGNIHNREATFTRNVETLYGPIESWETALTADNLHREDVWLRCEELTVRESPLGHGKTHELDASQDVRVRSREFTAWGGRMTYSEGKDLLVLEGDGRTDAQLWRQKKIGGEIDRLSSRKIYFWPSSDRFKLEGTTGAEFSQLSER